MKHTSSKHPGAHNNEQSECENDESYQTSNSQSKTLFDSNPNLKARLQNPNEFYELLDMDTFDAIIPPPQRPITRRIKSSPALCQSSISPRANKTPEPKPKSYPASFSSLSPALELSEANEVSSKAVHGFDNDFTTPLKLQIADQHLSQMRTSLGASSQFTGEKKIQEGGADRR